MDNLALLLYNLYLDYVYYKILSIFFQFLKLFLKDGV